MPHPSRAHVLEEALFLYIDNPDVSYRTLRVSEHRDDPEFVVLGICAGGEDEPECEITVGVSELRGFLTWLRDGD
jgi:hypothetical protein